MVKPCSLLTEESSLFWIIIIERKDTKIKVMKPLEETFSRTDMHAIWVYAICIYIIHAYNIYIICYTCYMLKQAEVSPWMHFTFKWHSLNVSCKGMAQETENTASYFQQLPYSHEVTTTRNSTPHLWFVFFTPYAFPYTTPKGFVYPAVNLSFLKWLCKPLHWKHRQEHSAVEATHYSPLSSDLYMVSSLAKCKKYFWHSTQVIYCHCSHTFRV